MCVRVCVCVVCVDVVCVMCVGLFVSCGCVCVCVFLSVCVCVCVCAVRGACVCARALVRELIECMNNFHAYILSFIPPTQHTHSGKSMLSVVMYVIY